jgi:O-glycosyl hydrolase
MMKLSVFLLNVFICISCTGNATIKDVYAPSTSTATKICINAGTRYQTIEGFSASDCWCGNFVGNHWSDEAKEGIAQLLFSRQINNSQPEGIGLSMWRFNLGGGTAEQGAVSGIGDISRRAECFLQKDGSLDWSHQAGQQFFLKKAKEYGCQSFILFSNTPPIYYTFNGKGYSARGGYANLRPECFDKYAAYITTVLQHYKENGIVFDYVSPVNEPQYDWAEPKQEGSGWQNAEVVKIARLLDSHFSANSLSTKILLDEAADWTYTYSDKGGERGNIIDDYFSPASANYIGNLPHIAPVIGGHSYWTDTDWSTLYSTRKQLADKCSAIDLKVFQTEWSLLNDITDTDYPGHDKATGMDIALYMSKVIHADLTIANVSSWSFWTAMDLERWGHKDRFLLISLSPSSGDNDITTSGTYRDAKTLWVLGNYSLFVRPGYQRAEVSIEQDLRSFFVSAYLSPSDDRCVAVFTNITSRDIPVDVSLKGIDRGIADAKMYLTSSSSNLKESIVSYSSVMIPAKSVATVVYRLK